MKAMKTFSEGSRYPAECGGLNIRSRCLCSVIAKNV